MHPWHALSMQRHKPSHSCRRKSTTPITTKISSCSTQDHLSHRRCRCSPNRCLNPNLCASDARSNKSKAKRAPRVLNRTTWANGVRDGLASVTCIPGRKLPRGVVLGRRVSGQSSLRPQGCVRNVDSTPRPHPSMLVLVPPSLLSPCAWCLPPLRTLSAHVASCLGLCALGGARVSRVRLAIGFSLVAGVVVNAAGAFGGQKQLS